VIYKLCAAAAWKEATDAGYFAGSQDDLRDGYIHLSAAHQVRATAAKYFRGVKDLLLVAVDPDKLGAALAWEPSRGGELFPHYYGRLPVSAAVEIVPIDLDGEGVPLIPERIA
jgi:uncharacterized protein (DUF952 family)